MRVRLLEWVWLRLRCVLLNQPPESYMESKIPLPTDNIYKFIALFSLVLLISSFATVIVATNTSNSVVFEHWVELETLRAQETLSVSEASRLKALERKIDIAVADKSTFVTWAGFISALGTLGMFVGFGYWHKRIQPLADQMAATQLELTKLQVLKLRSELESKGVVDP